jgi:hypothetical protein
VSGERDSATFNIALVASAVSADNYMLGSGQEMRSDSAHYNPPAGSNGWNRISGQFTAIYTAVGLWDVIDFDQADPRSATVARHNRRVGARRETGQDRRLTGVVRREPGRCNRVSVRIRPVIVLRH